MHCHLRTILAKRLLSPRFQPILALGDGSIFAHEGLIRGPSDSPLHSPVSLFRAARDSGLTIDVEYLCRQIVLESFAAQAAGSKIFLNVSPECLLQPTMRSGETLRYIEKLGLDPVDVIIELTENSPCYDYELLRQATQHYRAMGFSIAMDDLGEGFSSLRLWSELRPDYVKIDQHFIQGINHDPVKRQFVKSIQEIAKNSGCKVIAEGIENAAEFSCILDLGIAFGQGYHIGYPKPHLATDIPAAIAQNYSIRPAKTSHSGVNAVILLQHIVPVSRKTTNEEVFQRFEAEPNCQAIPVVDNQRPVGMISRSTMINRFAKPFGHELFGRRSCSSFMDKHPLIVDREMSLHDLSETITDMEPHHLATGFIITDQGDYMGTGSGHALLREITRMQLTAARYANPLSLLPGNVPINEHIDQWLAQGTNFHACYVDLDNFKPYNDVYGFQKGDVVIKLTANLLKAAVARDDFLGHVGGDDFILLMQGDQIEHRCQEMLKNFSEQAPLLYSEKDQGSGGINALDRKGNKVFYPMLSLSIGVVHVEPDKYSSHLEVAAAASVAKSQAKKISGNSLFLERRD